MTASAPDLQVQRVPWDSLMQHPRNPRNGDVEAIKRSIMVNGVYRPIIACQDGTILAGHHLWTALGELGHEDVSVIFLDVHPASTEATRIMVADNRTADLGTYDDGLLASLLKDIDSEAGLIGTGYTEDDFTRLLESITDPPHGFGTDDDTRCSCCGQTIPRL